MVWHGRPPTDSGQLGPGTYELSLKKIISKDNGTVSVLLANEDGGVFVNIDPDLDNKKTAWVFWRLAGAFDYPDAAYWALDMKKRPERDWDVLLALEKIQESGHPCRVVVVEKTWEGQKRANVAEMESIARAATETPKAGGGRTYDTEVPF